MIKLKQLHDLAKITQTGFDVALLQLTESRLREAELRSMLAALNTALRDRANSRLELTDAALIGGADVNWQIWVEQRRRSINNELAKCLADQERCRAAARRAFGRKQATISLIEAHSSELKRKATQKANYTS